ncbi:MAG: flavin reductase family protein, partial [Clostridia bacterium]|nr:flavin reductase family protein [Clostridia bacterium]
RALDSCGVLTGAKVDKFKKFSLTPLAGSKVSAPLVEQAPIGLECKVTQKLSLGTHDMYLATIEALVVDDELIDEKGKLRLEKAKLVAYSHGDYMALGRKLGSFGFSVRKHKKTPSKG